MQFGSGSKIFLIAVLVIAIGAIIGLSLGRSMGPSVRNDQAAGNTVDPVERYELGQNAYEPPKITTKVDHAQGSPGSSQEIGRRVNGKRILVPNEPARKKDRMQLIKEQQDYKQWYDGYFGDADADYSTETEEAATFPAEEYDRPEQRSDEQMETARLNATSYGDAAADTTGPEDPEIPDDGENQ